jgi:hypothetical protein
MADTAHLRTRRRVVDITVTILLLAAGVFAFVPFVLLQSHWHQIYGQGADWFPVMVTGTHAVAFVVIATISIRRLRRGKPAFWIPAIAGVAVAVGFAVSGFLLIAAAPCPSFC